MELDKANIVITGAASGIGLSILRECLHFDCHIVAADRNSALLEEVVSSCPKKVIPFAANLEHFLQIDQLFDFAVNAIGSVDLFIANAGFAYYEQLKDADWLHLEQIFQINTFSPIYSLMKMSRLNQGRQWKTVMVCSAMAEWAVPGYTIYSATKSAIRRFAEGYRFDNADNNLMVVYPIATRTRFFETAGKSVPVAFPLQSPDAVAKKIINGILTDRRTVYPSRLFRTVLIADRIFPLIKVLYQFLEFRKLKKWINVTSS